VWTKIQILAGYAAVVVDVDVDVNVDLDGDGDLDVIGWADGRTQPRLPI
jgi:hypothetical protein